MEKMTVKDVYTIFDLMKSKHGFKCSEIVIHKPKTGIKHTFGRYDKKLKRENFIIITDNNISFSELEILFKINDKISDYLKNNSGFFFERQEFLNYQDNIATYQIIQGS